MHPIVMQVSKFLKDALDGPVEVNENLIEEFGETCKRILRRQFTESRREGFTIRMSNMGKPLCQLQMEANGTEREPETFNVKMRNTYGDLVEALAIFVLKASGVVVQSEKQHVTLPIAGITVHGEYDIEINDALFDIKSVSNYSWKNKLGPDSGINKMAGDDAFGYLGQAWGYSEAAKKPFDGWIIINKESGHWHIMQSSCAKQGLDKSIIQGQIISNIRELLERTKFRRSFSDTEEIFKKKRTGNRILVSQCVFCPWKYSCWSGLQFRKQLASDADNPKWLYYTKIEDENEKVSTQS